MKTKRFDIGRQYQGSIGAPAITEQPGGRYVLASDYDALVEQLEAVGAGGVSLMGAQQAADSWNHWAGQMNACRNAAIEQAAKKAEALTHNDCFSGHEFDHCAEEIRSLKSEPGRYIGTDWHGVLTDALKALEIAEKFCGRHTAEECGDDVALPITDAVRDLRGLLSEPQ